MPTIRTRAAVGCKGFIFNTSGQLLLVKKQSRPNRVGHWDIPGGGLEVGEQPGQGLVREIMEETGLSLNSFELLDVISDTTKRGFSVYILFRGVCQDAEVQLSHEHEDYAWIDVADIRQYRLKRRYHAAIKSLAAN